jgi:tRNA-2-methylthio-N6-dimethylallyladenosine synthase
MNEYDSGLVARLLGERGAVPTDDPAQADLILVNSCSVRGSAEAGALHQLDQLAHLKRRNPALKLALLGCAARTQGEAVLESHPHVDWVLGPDHYEKLPELWLGPAAAESQTADELAATPSRRAFTEYDPEGHYESLSAQPWSRASTFISVQRGCNKRCSYCIVPFTRGPERNRPAREVIREIQEAVAAGVVEVTLLGQTINAWREGSRHFADLLAEVSQVEGLRRIRFTAPHPRHFDEDTLAVIADRPNLCKHLHIPFQSGSDRLLKTMRRQYTRSDALRLVRDLRAAAPGITLGTDLIAGYPGETEAEFAETLSLMEEVRFDNAFLFAYSPRAGTEAADAPDPLPEEVKQERLRRMIALQEQHSHASCLAQVGSEVEVLVEGPSPRDPHEWAGRSDKFHKVVFALPAGSSDADSSGGYGTLSLDLTGQIVPVLLQELRGLTLRGIALTLSSNAHTRSPTEGA